MPRPGTDISATGRRRKRGVARYALWFEDAAGKRVEAAGTIVDAAWDVTAFRWSIDPRDDADAWRAEAKDGVAFSVPRLDLAFGSAGPSELAGAPPALAEAALGKDRFGTLAATEVELSAGRWRVKTTSDDGIRVWVDGDLVIDDWTWHAPKRNDAELLLTAAQKVALRVEHFELDGFATLAVELEPIE
jgi:hypothetical protein